MRTPKGKVTGPFTGRDMLDMINEDSLPEDVQALAAAAAAAAAAAGPDRAPAGGMPQQRTQPGGCSHKRRCWPAGCVASTTCAPRSPSPHRLAGQEGGLEELEGHR